MPSQPPFLVALRSTSSSIPTSQIAGKGWWSVLCGHLCGHSAIFDRQGRAPHPLIVRTREEADEI